MLEPDCVCPARYAHAFMARAHGGWYSPNLLAQPGAARPITSLHLVMSLTVGSRIPCICVYTVSFRRVRPMQRSGRLPGRGGLRFSDLTLPYLRPHGRRAAGPLLSGTSQAQPASHILSAAHQRNSCNTARNRHQQPASAHQQRISQPQHRSPPKHNARQ